MGRAKILVVEDNPQFRALLRATLASGGFEAVEADSGAAAVRLASEQAPDMAILDLGLPDLDGFTVLERIRALPEGTAIPIVALSGMERKLERARESGAEFTDLLLKPVTPARLLAVVREHLPSGEGAGAGQPAATEAARELDLSRRLTREAAIKSAELTVLAGIAGVLQRTTKMDEILEEALERCREVAYMTAGAAYIGDGLAFELLAHVGYGGEAPEGLGDLFGHGELLNGVISGGEALRVPSDDLQMQVSRNLLETAGLISCVLVPFGPAESRAGALLLGSASAELDPDHVAFARAIAGQVSDGIALARAVAHASAAREETIHRLARAAEFRDNETARHTERMSHYCEMLARLAGLGEERAAQIRVASTMHDVGKIGIPDAILNKPGALSNEERRQMMRHAEFGHSILAGSGDPQLELAATIALSHQEWWDGGGYPQGLAGEEIPVEARIAAIADVFDALTSDRPYRGAYPVEKAVEMMREGAGSHLDPKLLGLFLNSLDEVLAIRERYRDAA